MCFLSGKQHVLVNGILMYIADHGMVIVDELRIVRILRHPAKVRI